MKIVLTGSPGYTIALKRNFTGKIKYGQQEYDFDEGIMTFMSPGQVLRIELKEGEEYNHSGFLLLFHPDSDELTSKGLPTVKSISEHLNISPNYLSALLKNLTGKSTQQQIQDKIIEKARHQLATTNLSVGEIAYNLGFGHPQSFSKLFKIKQGCRRLSFGLHSINWPRNRLQPFLRRSF